MGRAWVFGDDVSTDHIIPGRKNITTDPKLLAEAIFEHARPEFAKQVRVGDVVIAGDNFGCGSSREHAAIGLKETGVHIVAKSYGWIFFRNCINIGLLPLQALEDLDVADGDEVDLDVEGVQLTSRTKGKSYSLRQPPTFISEICEAGGMVEYLNDRRGYPV